MLKKISEIPVIVASEAISIALLKFVVPVFQRRCYFLKRPFLLILAFFWLAAHCHFQFQKVLWFYVLLPAISLNQVFEFLASICVKWTLPFSARVLQRV